MRFLPEEIKVGKRIQIMRENNDDEYLTCQILDIINEKEITISGPIKKSNLIFIHKGDLIRLYFTVENKGIYSYTAKVLSRQLSPIYTLQIERISEISKIQKREYFRIYLGLEVDKEHEILKNGEINIHKEKCDAKDISGGGMRINCNYKHKLQDEINCIFKINDLTIRTKARVKRVEEVDTFDYKYAIGISFEDMEESHRDEIIRYVFEQQRILRNKGLI